MYESRPIENRASEDRRSTLGRNRKCIRREYQLEDFREHPCDISVPSRGSLKVTLLSFSPWSRSHFSHSSSTPCLHSIGRNAITHHTPHLYQYPSHSTSCLPRPHAEASLVTSGSSGTTEMTLGLQQGGDGWMMAQSSGLRAIDVTVCELWTPRKTVLYTLNVHTYH